MTLFISGSKVSFYNYIALVVQRVPSFLKKFISAIKKKISLAKTREFRIDLKLSLREEVSSLLLKLIG